MSNIYMVMVMVMYTALVRSHQSTSAGSFGLVRPAWIRYTRSAVPQDVEPPRALSVLSIPVSGCLTSPYLIRPAALVAWLAEVEVKRGT